VGEIKILHHDRPTAAVLGAVQQGGNCCAHPPVTLRRG
jgi:hypothetical protein